MNDRRYQKQLRQLDLAQRATALQQMFGPEAQSRERLAGEQARAAFYANEAFAREQQRLARDEPLRQRQYLAETLGKEQMQRESDAATPNSRAAQERQQRQQENAARQIELDFANKTMAQRLQEYAARVGLAQTQATDAAARAQEFKMLQKPRVEDALLQPFVTREQLNALREQIRGSNQAREIQGAQEERAKQMFPFQLGPARAQALQTLQGFAAMQGPAVEVEDKIVPQGVPVQNLLSPEELQLYRALLPTTNAGVPPNVMTTLQTLGNEELARNFFESNPQRRDFGTSQVPGTVDQGQEISALLAAMRQTPNGPWNDEAQAIAEIARNPRRYGMYDFDPSLISPDDFLLALDVIRRSKTQPQ